MHTSVNCTRAALVIWSLLTTLAVISFAVDAVFDTGYGMRFASAAALATIGAVFMVYILVVQMVAAGDYPKVSQGRT